MPCIAHRFCLGPDTGLKARSIGNSLFFKSGLFLYLSEIW